MYRPLPRVYTRLIERMLTTPHWVWLGAGILLRCLYWYYDRNYFIDASAQILLGQRWLEQGSWSLPILSDGQEIQWINAHAFMPIYGVLSAWLGNICGNYLWGNFLLDVGGIALVYISCYQWLVLSLPQYPRARTLILILLALSLAPLKYLTGSGLLAFAGMMVGLSGMWKLITSTHHSWLALGMTIMGWALACGTRQAYLPFILIPLGWGLVQVFQKPSNQATALYRFQHGFLALCCLLIAYACWQWGQLTDPYFRASETGFFPTHLLKMDPFGIKSLLYLPYPQVSALAGKLGDGEGLFHGFLHVLNAALVATVAYWGWINQRKFIRIGLLTLAIGILNLGELCYLSITIAPENWRDFGIWTYVMETRYYMPLMWLMLVYVGLMATTGNYPFRYPRTARLVLGLALIFNLIALILQIRQKDSLFQFSATPAVYSFIQQQQAQNPDKTIYIYPGPEWYTGLIAGAETYPSWIKPDSYESTIFPSSCWLVYHIEEDTLPSELVDSHTQEALVLSPTYRALRVD